MVNVFLTQNDGAILGPIAKVLGWMLNGIFEFLGNFGIENAGFCIIIFTFFVNALMIPLTIKQQKFTKMSSKMTPEINKINQKYKGKKDEVSIQKQNLELQAVYQKYGASPTSGCLPLLITLPIMFALYRVIYNIPAYVSGIKALYENIAVAMQNTNYLATMTEYANQFPNLNVSKWGDISQSISINHLIDVMSQFNSSHWAELMSNPAFSSITDVIATNSEQIMRINEFGFGINISEVPMQQIMGAGLPFGIRAAYVLVPIFAIVTQMISTKMITAKTSQQSTNPNDPTAATMKSMNTTMPIMMGLMCLMIPVGVGIYIIAGSVFRIIQQVFVDKYMDTLDVEQLIEKNKEKQKKRKERMGIDPNMSMEEVAKRRVSTMQDKAKVDTSKQINVSKNTYKEGSISHYANMLSNKNGDKERK